MHKAWKKRRGKNKASERNFVQVSDRNMEDFDQFLPDEQFFIAENAMQIASKDILAAFVILAGINEGGSLIATFAVSSQSKTEYLQNYSHLLHLQETMALTISTFTLAFSFILISQRMVSSPWQLGLFCLSSFIAFVASIIAFGSGDEIFAFDEDNSAWYFLHPFFSNSEN